MHDLGRCVALSLLCAAMPACAAQLPACSQGAKTFLPCEMSFEWQANELAPGTSAFKDDLLNVQFRSPNHVTYAMRGYAEGEHLLRVRFSPTEPGAWTYHVSSSVKSFDNQESTFNVADSGLPGFVAVANLRHWWTTNKQPQLWLAAAVPFLAMDQSNLESWLDARKHDGFTHVRGDLLTLKTGLKPLANDGLPNPAYFDALDDRLLAADARGFTLDLALADAGFVRSGAMETWDQRDALVRYLVARYGGLNVTWQGIENYEDVPDGRELLKDLGTSPAEVRFVAASAFD